MKGSQVAGLAVGWLTVALSMAAIGAAAVARVGVSTAESQVQITVARPVSQEKSGSSLAPTNDPTGSTPVQGAAYLPTVSLAQYAKAVTTPRRSSAPPVQTSTATAQSAPSTTTVNIVVRNDASLSTGEASLTTTEAATSAEATTRPARGLTTKHPVGNKNQPTSDSPTVVAQSQSTWGHPQEATSAGCQTAAPAVSDPTATSTPAPTPGSDIAD